MIIVLPLEDVPAFNSTIDELDLGFGVDVFGPFLSNFENVQYACGNLCQETVTQLKIVFPNLKVIEHA